MHTLRVPLLQQEVPGRAHGDALPEVHSLKPRRRKDGLKTSPGVHKLAVTAQVRHSLAHGAAQDTRHVSDKMHVNVTDPTLETQHPHMRCRCTTETPHWRVGCGMASASVVRSWSASVQLMPEGAGASVGALLPQDRYRNGGPAMLLNVAEG